MSAIPKYLWQCSDLKQQLAWCERALKEGKTLTDPGLWLGGTDPQGIIRKLRKSGLKIESIRVSTWDAARVEHPNTPAWRLKTS